MKTKITELLQIEYPVFQGGMAWVAEHKLAAAVSNAGGLGIIGAASAPPEVVREEIRKCKELTDKPFGVNIMLLNPNAEDVAKIVVEEGVKAVTTGAGNPGKFMELWKNAGVKVIPVVASVAMAKMMERAGADAVVAEGMESGGHIGSTTTMALVPQVVDAVSIPVSQPEVSPMAEEWRRLLCWERKVSRWAPGSSHQRNPSSMKIIRIRSSRQRILIL